MLEAYQHDERQAIRIPLGLDRMQAEIIKAQTEQLHYIEVVQYITFSFLETNNLRLLSDNQLSDHISATTRVQAVHIPDY
jgi:hypothetical protein